MADICFLLHLREVCVSAEGLFTAFTSDRSHWPATIHGEQSDDGVGGVAYPGNASDLSPMWIKAVIQSRVLIHLEPTKQSVVFPMDS
jgi:hypothetical protein